jgi:endonuclease YncB( thermonuclease family)
VVIQATLGQAFKAHRRRIHHGQIALDGTTKAGDAATRIMRQLAPNGCKAVISPIATDVYGRIVAKVTIGNVDVGLEMIRRGFAIALDDAPAAYVRAEKRARRERIGLWAVGGFLEPKQFRRTNPWEGPSA